MPANVTGKQNVTALSQFDRALGRMLQVEVDPKNQAAADLAGDAFFQLYQGEPAFRDPIPEGREFNHLLIDWLKKSPSWDANRAQTVGTIFPSLLSAGFLYTALMTDEALQDALKKEAEAEKARQEAEKAEREAQGLAQAAQANNDPNLQKKAQQAQQQAQAARQKAQTQGQQAMGALEDLTGKKYSDAVRGQIVKQAADDTQETLAQVAGWGAETSSMTTEDVKTVLHALETMKKQGNWLDEITALLGRVKGWALEAKAVRTNHSGVIYGDGYTQKMENIFPSELALLRPDVPALVRADQFAQFADHGLLGLVEGTNQEKQGDIVLIVDESGSMSGDPVVRAKALALGIAQAAKSGGQEYKVFSFAESIGPKTVASNQDWVAHMEWAAQFMHGGGTDFNLAFETAAKYIENLPATRRESCDIVMITDGQAGINDDIAKRVNLLRKELGTRVVALIVNNSVHENGLPRVTDRVLEVVTDDDLKTITQRLIDALSREDKE